MTLEEAKDFTNKWLADAEVGEFPVGLPEKALYVMLAALDNAEREWCRETKERVVAEQERDDLKEQLRKKEKEESDNNHWSAPPHWENE